MQPIRCLTSHLTSDLLKFRNPQGLEENWIVNGGQINNRVIYCGKVVTTEIALGILCVTAVVESVAYGILGVGSVFLGVGSLLISRQSSARFFSVTQLCLSLVSSSGFTLFWNIGNLFIFNPFCKNVFTHESFARYSMDHWVRGRVFRVACQIALTAVFIIGIYLRQPVSHVNTRAMLSEPFLRPEDILYIADWTVNHPIRLAGIPIAGQRFEIPPMMMFGQRINQEIKDGVNFFKEFILKPGQVDAEDRQSILEADADICTFILSRAVYIYAFGEKRDEQIPAFFKVVTKLLIAEIRQKYSKEEGAALEGMMQSSKAFEEEPNTPHDKEILNDLKKAAYEEFQKGILISRCWELACQEVHQEAHQEEIPA